MSTKKRRKIWQSLFVVTSAIAVVWLLCIAVSIQPGERLADVAPAPLFIIVTLLGVACYAVRKEQKLRWQEEWRIFYDEWCANR